MTGRAQPRRAAKVDGNAAQIVRWLEDAGAVVYVLGEPFDLLVGWRGRWDLVEIKRFGGTVTQGQVADMVRIAGSGLPPVILATTAEDVRAEMRRRSKAELVAISAETGRQGILDSAAVVNGSYHEKTP